MIRVSARCILKKSDPAEVAALCDKLDLQVEQVSERRETKYGWNLSVDLTVWYDIFGLNLP